MCEREKINVSFRSFDYNLLPFRLSPSIYSAFVCFLNFNISIRCVDFSYLFVLHVAAHCATLLVCC